MARPKMINAEMAPLREKVADYMGKQTEIRARHAALAEEEILAMRESILDDMFILHAGSGPSEIANSTGLSRTTVIRWRKEFEERMADEISKPMTQPQASDLTESPIESIPTVEVEQEPYTTVGSEKYDGYPTAYAETQDGRLYLLTYEDFGIGESPHEAEDNRVDRPDWLTDDVMRDIVDTAGVKLMLAPW